MTGPPGDPSLDAPRPRVVITGVGAVCSLGRTPAAIWESIEAGRAGIGPITRFDASGFTSRIAAEVPQDDRADDRFDATFWASLDRRSRFAAGATLDAIRQASLVLSQENRHQVAVLLASARPDDEALLAAAAGLEHGDVDAAARALSASANAGSPTDRIAALLGVSGPTLQIEDRGAGGLSAVIEAAAMIRRGDALVAIAGGAEAPITPLSLAAYQGAGMLSSRNEEPESASRPLDAMRDGFVLGEGAAVVVLELLDVAVARGASILAEIEGEGLSFAPGESGYATLGAESVGQAIRGALVSSGRIQSEVDILALHASGDREGDRAEAIGVRRVFGTATRHHMYTPALKSHTGHLLGASGVLSLAVMIQALQRQVIPATRNLDQEDPEIDLDANARGPRADSVLVAMVNAAGGPECAAVLIAHPRAMRRVPEPDELPGGRGLPIPDRDAELP